MTKNIVEWIEGVRIRENFHQTNNINQCESPRL